MLTCTFQRPVKCPLQLKQELISCLEDLICNYHVDTFYVGNEGPFDALTHWLLYGLKKNHYPDIQYKVVLAYPPTHPEDSQYFDAIYPSELDQIPYNKRIEARDQWMLDRSDYVVSCRESVYPE